MAVVASWLPEGHVLPKTLYESKKILRALKMPYEQIHACPKGCILFRKEHEHDKYCPECKSSRYVEVDSGDGQMKQLKVPRKCSSVSSSNTKDSTTLHDRGVGVCYRQ